MKLFYKQTFRISRLSEIYRAFRRFTGFKNNTCNAFITKIKEPRVQTQFLVAGVERFVRSRRRNSVLLDKSVYMLGKTRHSRTVEKKFSTFREENFRPQRGHKEKQPHKYMRLFSLFIWLRRNGYRRTKICYKSRLFLVCFGYNRSRILFCYTIRL